MKDIGNQECRDDITCPWCGYEYCDSWEFRDDGNEKCQECGKEFTYSANHSVTYSTYRKVCEGEHQYVLDPEKFENPYIYKGKNWCLYRCTKCLHEVIKTGEVKEKPYIIEV
jgi:hypothetical protein